MNIKIIATFIMGTMASIISIRFMGAIIKDILTNEHSMLGIAYRVIVVLIVVVFTILGLKLLAK